MSASLIRQVWQRAASRCEYCHLPAEFFPLTFHVDHIIPRQHGGITEFENLALACLHCNRHKAPNLAGLDVDGKLVKLFDPRRDLWSDHFEWSGADLIGRTPARRATVRVLAINAPDFRAVRDALQREGGLHSIETSDKSNQVEFITFCQVDFRRLHCLTLSPPAANYERQTTV